MVGVTDCCVVLDVGDEDVIDCPDIRTEIRQLRREKKELVEKNNSLTERNGELVVKTESLAKEKKVAENKEVLAVQREKGERLLRLGYAIDKGGGERVSVM